MTRVPRVFVQASKDRKAVRAWAVRPGESGPIMSALERVAESFPGAQVVPADFRFEREVDAEYSFGTLGEIRFAESQHPRVLAQLARHVTDALAKHGYGDQSLSSHPMS